MAFHSYEDFCYIVVQEALAVKAKKVSLIQSAQAKGKNESGAQNDKVGQDSSLEELIDIPSPKVASS